MLLIAGITNLETTVDVEGFPYEYAKSRFAFNGVHDRVGGVGYNLARVCSALDQPVLLATMLGKDLVGDVLEASLRTLPHVSPVGIQRVHERSLRTVVLKSPDGKGAMNTDLKDSQEASYPAAARQKLLKRATRVHVTNINWALDFAREASERGLSVPVDVQNIRSPREDAYNDRFLALADTVFLSGENLECPAKEAIGTLMRRFPVQRVIVTLGAKGVLFSERGQDMTSSPAEPLAPSDTPNQTGAGDAFAAGVLAALERGEGLCEAVEAGQAAARLWIVGEIRPASTASNE